MAHAKYATISISWVILRVLLLAGAFSEGDGTTLQFRGNFYGGVFSRGLRVGDLLSFVSSCLLSSTCQVGHLDLFYLLSHILKISSKFCFGGCWTLHISFFSFLFFETFFRNVLFLSEPNICIGSSERIIAALEKINHGTFKLLSGTNYPQNPLLQNNIFIYLSTVLTYINNQ